jgi:hypothetical protein
LLHREAFWGERIVDHEGSRLDLIRIGNPGVKLFPINAVWNGSFVEFPDRRWETCRLLIIADDEFVVRAALSGQQIHDVKENIITDNSDAAVMASEELNATQINMLTEDLAILAVDETKRARGNQDTAQNSELCVSTGNRNNTGQSLI